MTLPSELIAPCEHGLPWPHPSSGPNPDSCPGGRRYRLDVDKAAWALDYEMGGALTGVDVTDERRVQAKVILAAALVEVTDG